MRLRRLDLVRYGRFTDRSLELPDGERDLHIVFGPNEAGKSTARAAIEDLLFGIPARSPYNFVHDYGSLRVGAAIEDGDGALEVLRRKGNRDTLLGADGLPQAGGEGALKPYLAGADRAFFGRMFSLDHVRLRAGGQEILDARDDVGQMLFAAGSGIAGLRHRLGDLLGEADALWSARRAGHRKFYGASDRLQEAERAVREQTVTAARWRELKRAYDRADRAHAEIDRKIRAASAERSRLGRIRRVLRDVRRMHECDGQLADLGEVVVLPEDAAGTLADVERKESAAETRIAVLRDRLDQARQELEGLVFDERLVLRGEDIGQLHERRIEVRGERADLPKREAELHAAQDDLRARAAELGWEGTAADGLMARIPPRTRVRAVSSLLGQGGRLEGEVANGVRRLEEARAAHAALRADRDGLGEPSDVSGLAIVLRTVREQGDLAGRIRAAERDLEDACRRVRQQLKALNPGGVEEGDLADLVVPTTATVRQHRDQAQDWERRWRDAQHEAAAVGKERDRAVGAREHTVRDGNLVTAGELRAARAQRDALWSRIKRACIEGAPVSGDPARDPEDLAGAFEPAVAKADDLADRRFDRAEAAGRLAELERKIGELELRCRQLQEYRSELTEEKRQREAEWAAAWGSVPFRLRAPESMLEWMEGRRAVLDAVAGRAAAEGALESLRAEEREARERILGELASLGANPEVRETDRLNEILERAAEVQRRREAEVGRKQRLEADLADAAREVARRERDLDAARRARGDWQAAWATALDGLGLPAETAPQAVEAQIEVLDQMRETANRIRSLRHDRIDKIRRDVAGFEGDVRDLVGDLAPELREHPAEEAVLELEQRLAEARRVQELRKKKAEEVDELTESLAGRERDRRERTAAVVRLQTVAGVGTRTALAEAVARSDRRRLVERERRALIGKLEQDGDGKSIEELVEECAGAAVDEIGAQEQSVEAGLEDLRGQQTAAAEERSRAREAFRAIGGGDAAARAAARRQEALADMRHAAERYVRVKTSATLLRWAIDRYRREKQAPLLRRAGDLFRTVTGGSFLRLQVEFDDQDRARLAAVRPDDRAVPVSGMSTGTADQLYLALRLAAIEDYLERGKALPFVADDLFIQFDDVRAAAGLTLLAALSQSTQVLFFTHHRHLVELARQSLGDRVNLLTLSEPEVSAA